MRLLILTPEFDGAGGGIFTFYRSLVPALCAEGIEVRVLEGSASLTYEDRSVRIRHGVQVETLETDRLARWVERFSTYAAAPGLQRHLAAAWAMWEQAQLGASFDIVEATDWGLPFVPPVMEAKCPLVVQCHGSIGQIADHDPIAGNEMDNLLARLIEREVFSVAPAIQTSSIQNAEFWHGETGRAVAVFLPAWQPSSNSYPKEIDDRVLVVGRLQRWKGPAVLCGALRRLGPRAPIVDWVGRDTAWETRNGFTSEHIARTFPDLWGRTFVHHAQASPEETARRQARAVFNIVPSTWDVFNFTVVEAMASGRPAIVSTGAGASDLIEDGENGFLFQPNDSDALATAIDRVLGESSARLSEIGRAAKKTVRTALDPQKIAQQRVAAYRTVIDEFDVRPPSPIGGWLGALCRPSDAARNDMMFLENFPLREIAKHVLARTWRRVRRL